jgi:hypothetical protein
MAAGWRPSTRAPVGSVRGLDGLYLWRENGRWCWRVVLAGRYSGVNAIYAHGSSRWRWRARLGLLRAVEAAWGLPLDLSGFYP